MKRNLSIVVVALVVLSCASVFAGSQKAASGKTHSTHVVGEVVSVDAANSIFVVRENLKDKSTKEITINCEPGTKIQTAGKTVTLGELAVGDTVTVAYGPDASGKNMARSVNVMKPRHKTEEPANKS